MIAHSFMECDRHGRLLAVDRDGRLLGRCDECAREYAEILSELEKKKQEVAAA